MTDKQLPPLPTPKFTETIRGVPCITVTEHEHLMHAYALQALAQVQGAPVAWKYQPQDGIKHPAFTEHEAIAIAHGKDGSVVPLYTPPQPVQATQAEVTDEKILKTLRPDVWMHVEGLYRERMLADARAILALRPAATFCVYCGGNDEDPVDHCMDCTRPAAVPMTDEQVRKLFSEKQWYELGEYPFTWVAAQVIIRAAEAHHGVIAKSNKETT